MKKFLFITSLIFTISISFISAENIINNKDLLNDNIVADINDQVKVIPFEKPIVGKREKQLINEVIDSDGIGSGKYVKQFEQKFAKLSGAKYGIACSNGTTALHTTLLAYGIKPGDKVITTPFSFIASANPILYCGAKPIFADIDEKTFNIDPKSVEKILKKEKNVKAVVCVHLFGLSCDMDKLLKLKKKYNFILIEDACQAHLAKYKNKFVGSIGDAGVFSFQATKNMTTGEGGIVLTNDFEIEKLSRKIINHGRSNAGKNEIDILGYNFGFSDISAAIGIAQCDQIEKFTEQRIANAKKLSDGLKDLDFLEIPVIPKGYKHVFHQYIVKVKSDLREKFKKYLMSNGIFCDFFYTTVIYKEPLYQKLGYKEGLCPVAEKVDKEIVYLPVYPSLTDKDIDTIIKVIKGFKK